MTSTNFAQQLFSTVEERLVALGPKGEARCWRAERRAELRKEWLANQEAEREARLKRKEEAEVRGAEWLMLRVMIEGAVEQYGCGVSDERRADLWRAFDINGKFTRRPLGRWTKGKVWSTVAEVYV
jgi:hypothetical protein